VVPVIIAHMRGATDRANRKAGRPSKGPRVQVNLRIPVALRKQLLRYRKYRVRSGRDPIEWNALFIVCIEYWWKHHGGDLTARRKAKLQKQARASSSRRSMS
jgi:hypothetical protein